MRIPKWVNSPQIGIKAYIAAFCVTVFLAVMLLGVAAFLPQTAIRNHIADSLPIIARDLDQNYLFDNSIGSKIDVGTDLMMLHTSLTTNDRYLGSILANPVYESDDLSGWESNEELMARLAYDEPADDVWFYARYWMGFRVVLRLALTFFTYGQIKRYLSFAFLALFAAVICSVSKHAGSKIGFLFALSIILVRPHVMATSMQFTCCFLIAFLAMLLIPWLHRHEKWEGLFFLELGMITMYFDFYTVPLVTVGFPLLYLQILKQESGEKVCWKNLLRNLAIWFLGYGFMWIAKLCLTNLLTSEDALGFGFESLLSRIGLQKDAELTEYYSLKAAFDGIREAMFSDEVGAVVYLLGAGIILTVVLYKIMRGHGSFATLRNGAPYLFFAAIPLVWFVITKQPIALHYFFQYRTIALTHWAAGVFLYYLLSAKRQELTKTE